MEIWEAVKYFENNYKVSNLGKVKNIKTGRILKGVLDKDKYLKLTLYNGGIKFNKIVHRLIAQAFVPNPKNKPQVNHIDANKQNNNAINLEWCTPLENIRHAMDKGIKGTAKGSRNNLSKLVEKDIIYIRKTFLSKNALALKYKVHISTIERIISRKTWRHI